MSDDVRRRLDEAGRRPVPEPDPVFGDALEARLLAVAGSVPPVPPEPPRARLPRVLRIAAGATLAAAAALVLALAVGQGQGGPPAAPELKAPVNVEVALADGTRLEDPSGLPLPDGTVVRVGDGGSAQIGDVVLRPGDVATIVDGRVRIDRPSPAAVATTPRSTASPVGSAPPTPAPRPTPSPTPAPGRTPVPTVGPTVAPATPTPEGTPTPTPTLTPTPARPRLRARAVILPSGAHAVAVTWTAVSDAQTYVLLVSGARQAPAPDPVYPGSRELGEYAAPPSTRLRFRVPIRVTEVRLMVVALDADGSELARSRVVTVTFGG